MTPTELRKLAAYHADEARHACDQANRSTTDTELIEAIAIAQQHLDWRTGLVSLALRLETPAFP